MFRKRIFSAILAGLLVLAGTAAITESPASAATKIKICNSKYSTANASSDSYGYVYKAGTDDSINPGDCKSYSNSKSLRIQFNYYRSYKFRRYDGKYGACHNSTQSTKSNPGNSKQYYYRGFANKNCRD